MQQENLISLLKETLKFYADPNNYVVGDNSKDEKHWTENYFSRAQVNVDGGHMAKFALEQVKKFENLMSNVEAQYEKLQQKIEQEVNEKSPEEIQKMINDLIK